MSSKWNIAGRNFRDRNFTHRNNALDFAAAEFVRQDMAEMIMVTEVGGWAHMILHQDLDGAGVLAGRYTDDHKRYLTARIAHEMALRNVKAIHNVRAAA